MARLTLARVRFSRQANDGDYGSETVSVEREVVAEEGEVLHDEDILTALHVCRLHVEAELSQSPNWKVRRAVTYPEVEPEQVAPEPELEDLPY